MIATAPKKIQPEVKAGIFITLGIVMIMASILMLGGGETLFHSHYNLKARFDDVSGLSKGSNVKSGGINIGRVLRIDFDESYKNIVVTMLIKEEYKQRIRKNSKIQVLTQGVLGDKYLEIVEGSLDMAAAADNDFLETKGAEGITQILKGGENVVRLLEQNLVNIKKITDSFASDQRSDKFFSSLADATKNLNETLENLNKGKGTKELNQTLKNLRLITDKMNNGEGTIGALLNDSALYEDLRLLIGGAGRNKILQFFVKQAVKTSDDHKKIIQQDPTPVSQEKKN